MSHRRFVSTLLPAVILLALAAGLGQAQGPLPTAPAGGPQPPAFGTAFTYQGQLKKAGELVNDTCAMRFILYDTAVGGAQVGPIVERSSVAVSEGLFTIPDLDFGYFFEGERRFLEVAVQCPGDAGYSVLTPTPYAVNAGFLEGYNASAFALVGHDHLGETWTTAVLTQTGLSVQGGATGLSGEGWMSGVYGGSEGQGVWGYSPNSAGIGVAGTNGATSGDAVGVYGRSESQDGIGVKGFVNSIDGAAVGVAGETSSTEGVGVQGYTPAITGYTTGVYGHARSTNGTGILGFASASSGPTIGVSGQSASLSGTGVYGSVLSSSGVTKGVHGKVASPSGIGVHGESTATSGYAWGVYGEVDSSDGTGVYGRANSTLGTAVGVVGHTNAPDGAGVTGSSGSTSGGTGVYGFATAANGIGVVGRVSATGDYSYGVRGEVGSTLGKGVYGYAYAAAGATHGVYGEALSGTGTGVYGVAGAASGTTYGVYGRTYSTTGYGVYGRAATTTSTAGYFYGNVSVTGNLSKGGGSFKIDHPQDPANQYLYHSFVESPDMMNIYNGVVVLDEGGTAWVELPTWFETLNRDLRYQLTPVGAPAPNLYIAAKVQNNRFQIAGGPAGLEVSWQVTGIRQDPYANAHRIPVEEWKPASERGTYLYPELYGQPAELGLDYQRELSRQQAEP